MLTEQIRKNLLLEADDMEALGCKDEARALRKLIASAAPAEGREEYLARFGTENKSLGFAMRAIAADAWDGAVRATAPTMSEAAKPLPQHAMPAWRDVVRERRRQIAEEEWTPEHDDEHSEAEMARAAGCYAIAAGGYAKGKVPPMWPWDLKWWKPSYGRRDLIKAGALILAEIERIDRAAAKGESDE